MAAAAIVPHRADLLGVHADSVIHDLHARAAATVNRSHSDGDTPRVSAGDAGIPVVPFLDSLDGVANQVAHDVHPGFRIGARYPGWHPTVGVVHDHRHAHVLPDGELVPDLVDGPRDQIAESHGMATGENLDKAPRLPAEIAQQGGGGRNGDSGARTFTA